MEASLRTEADIMQTTAVDHARHTWKWKLSIPSTSSLKRFCMIKSFSFLSCRLMMQRGALVQFLFFPNPRKMKTSRLCKKSQTHLLRVMEYSSSFHSISVCFCFTNVKQTHYIWYRWGMSSGGISLCLVIKMHSCLKTDIAVLERHPCWRAHCLPLFLSLPQLFV